MAKAKVAGQFENLDQRLVRVEQILPTLATKQDLLAAQEDLRREIEAATAPLATKEELRRAIEPLATKEELHRAIEPLATKEELQRAIEPLATKEELRRAIEPLATNEKLRRAIEPLATKAELLDVRDELRRHLDVTREALQSDIQLIAEHVARIATKVYGG
jgi:transcriptional regulator of NAD metabolism